MAKKTRPPKRFQPKGLTILYEDKDILVVDKSAGLLTIATMKADVNTAFYILNDYVRRGIAKSKSRVFIVHRLDRDTSGILIFAKNEKARTILQKNWKETVKLYLTVVHGILEKKEDVITSYLTENKAHIMYSTKDHNAGMLSHTAYKVLHETRDLSLLEINLVTGRKNQIRVHLAEAGHPVVGDKKYGEKKRTHKRLALHAKSITFKHPINGKSLTFEAKVPAHFNRLIGDIEQLSSKKD
ncbi:MAG: RluA family pseudouridine synthase [Deltaproteobacteria bacterium]|jgi:23S rRNA pseudouridine1911/1915/1917 synthase|nr:RluA family pseudouridine synthase [Deltaproteobacteria bacterium]